METQDCLLLKCVTEKQTACVKMGVRHFGLHPSPVSLPWHESRSILFPSLFSPGDQCPDYGIDEKNCNAACSDGQKIRPEWICDGYPQCAGTHQGETTHRREASYSGRNHAQEISLLFSKKCFLKTLFSDASDECGRNCNRSAMYEDDKYKTYFKSEPGYCSKFNNKTACSEPKRPYLCDNGKCMWVV